MAWKPDYITVGQLKAYRKITDTEDDAELAAAVTAASRAIDTFCGRQFGKVDTPEERFYEAKYDRHRGIYVVQIDDLATVEGTLMNGEELDPANLYPRNAVAKGKVWEELRVESAGEVGIVAPWGWPAFPSGVPFAARLQASRFVMRRDSPFGVVGSPNDGSELRLLSKVDPDVAVSLAGYRRWWAAA
jgi:hypothetical protein